MLIINGQITLTELASVAQNFFTDMVKGVVDVEKEILVIDAELHADLEAYLLEKGSKQQDLWGINLYPGLQGDDFIEFDSMINIRPSQNNRSRSVECPKIREKIKKIVGNKINA
jgi:hypothetical protein